MPFGQVVIGAPGTGKTTYCNGMQQFLSGIERKCVVVNLDPANDQLPYDCSVDISSLIQLEEVMDLTDLGPNGAFMYAMEFLEKNIEWLRLQLEKFKGFQRMTREREREISHSSDCYVLFDFPGQIELFTHHKSVSNIIKQLEKWDYRLTVVHLVDSVVCTQPTTFISSLLLSLSTMLQLSVPHVNVLSKIDLLESYGKKELAFNLDFYTDVLDLNYLLQYLDTDAFSQRYKRLNKALCELVEDYSLVSFQTLNIQDKESVYKLLKIIDKSNGYIFGGLTLGNESIQEVTERDIAWQIGGEAIQETLLAERSDDDDETSGWDL